jgi:hypothetical protein
MTMTLTTTDEVNFTRLWQWWQWLSIIKALQRGQFLAIINLNGMLKKEVAVLIVYISMLIIMPKNTVSNV